MQFLYPTFLWALAALAIPVIIHLFYFRRFRKVYFSNVSFLKEVKEETSARSRLRNLLVLLMRLLAIACLVFAFAQPFIPAEQEVARGRKAVSIYVDNSFSMQAESDQLPLLEMAKRRAKDIVRAYGVEDRFQLLSNDFSGKQQRLYGQEEVIDLIEELEIGPQTRLLSSVLARQEAALNLDNIPNKIAYQLSDFQRTVSDLNDDVDSTLQLNLVPLRAVRESNIAIDSVWFEAPVPLLNQNNSLLVRVRNYSDEAKEDLRLSLSYQGQTKPVGQLSIPARDYVLDTVNLNITEAGLGRAELRITDYPVEFDDSYLISFRTSEVLSVLNIHSGIADRRLAAALNGISVFAPDFLSAQQIDYGRLNEYQLIVLTDLTQISSGLANELKQYMENGGNVLLFPPQTADVQSYSSFLSSLPADRLANFEETRREVSSLNNDEFVFKGVFRNEGQALRLPTTQGNFTLNRQSAQPAEALMRYRDGQIALAKYRLNLGHLYLNTSPLDESVNNLGLNAEVFVPMLYKMAISAGRQRPESYTIGRDQLIETNRRQASAERVFRLSGNDGEFIPEQRIVGQRIFLSINEQLQQSGFYELLLDDSAPLDLFAFNFDRAESDLSYLSEEEIETLTAGKANILDGQNEAELIGTIQTNNEGQPLWRYFIWGVLIFLLVEVLLLRFWKT
ncbi:MAG: BatA domain-containing protein [Bacteroidota bacterium]